VLGGLAVGRPAREGAPARPDPDRQTAEAVAIVVAALGCNQTGAEHAVKALLAEAERGAMPWPAPVPTDCRGGHAGRRRTDDVGGATARPTELIAVDAAAVESLRAAGEQRLLVHSAMIGRRVEVSADCTGCGRV
jgi:hypothetical protein